MTVCRYYLQGRCRYGDRCWNEHTDSSPVPQRRDNHTWVAPPVASPRNYSQAQFSRHNFSSNYREPAPRNDYNSRHDFSNYYRDRAPRSTYDYDSRRNSSSYYRDPVSSYEHDYDSRSSTPTENHYYYDRYGSGSIPSGNREQYHSSGSYDRSNAPKKKTSTFQPKSSNRFETLVHVNDAGRNDQDKDSNLILEIKNEIKNWENMHIWPFSCCSHFKDPGTCLSGFVDISPEELRYRAYEAEKNGAFAFYTGIVAEALNGVRKKWDVLKNPTSEVLQSIQKGYYGVPDFCEENLKKLIPECRTGSFSAEHQINKGVFSQEYDKTTTSGAFSFKLAHLNSSESLGGSISSFGSLLSRGNDVRSSFPTSGTASSSSFGSFGSSSVPASSVLPSVSLGFGSSNKERHDANKADNVSEGKSCTYAQLENLTDDERTQFSSQTFTLGKIPSRPPPIEFCF